MVLFIIQMVSSGSMHLDGSQLTILSSHALDVLEEPILRI